MWMGTEVSTQLRAPSRKLLQPFQAVGGHHTVHRPHRPLSAVFDRQSISQQQTAPPSRLPSSVPFFLLIFYPPLFAFY